MRCGKNYWPAVAFTFWATFRRAINRPKNWPPTIFFSRIHSSMDKLLSFQETKITNFFLYCARECKGKEAKIIINPQFYFTDTRKQLWNCCNIYESAVSITSPLKTITIRYGLLPMVLIPNLTNVDEGIVCLSLLDGSWAASAVSVQMRSLYRPFNLNFVPESAVLSLCSMLFVIVIMSVVFKFQKLKMLETSRTRFFFNCCKAKYLSH